MTVLLATTALAGEARFDDARWWFLGLGAASAATIAWQEILAPEQPARTQEGFAWLYEVPDTPQALAPEAKAWATASDVLLLGAIGADLAYAGTLRDVDLALHLEALMAGFVAIQTLKLTVRAPRPTTWITDDHLAGVDDVARRAELEEMRAGTDAWMSFPSGHTGLAATAGSALATQLWLEGRRGWAAGAGVAALGVTIATGTARVKAGKHHRIDTVVGGALGTAAGVAVPVIGFDESFALTAMPGGVGLAGRW